MPVQSISKTVRLTAALLAGLAASGCLPATCEDIECVMSNLSFTVDGKALPLKRIAGNLLPVPVLPPGTGDDATIRFTVTPLSVPNFGDPLEILEAGKPATPGMGTPDEARTPRITNDLMDVTLDDPGTEKVLSIAFDDPNGERPAFCWRPADKQNPFAHAVWCLPAERDLEISGTFIIRMRLNAFVPAGRAITFGTPTTIQPSPIRPTPIVATAISGTPVVFSMKAPLAPLTPGGGGGGGGGSNVWSRCINAPLNCPGTRCGNFQVCASSNLGGCATGGYLANGSQWFPCAACANCNAAAQSAIAFCCPMP